MGITLDTTARHELYTTLMYTLLPKKSAPNGLSVSVSRRLDDIAHSAGSTLFSLLYYTLERIIFIPVALILSALFLADFLLYFALSLLINTLAVCLNVLYLLVNNLILHIALWGLIRNLVDLVIAFPFIMMDTASMARFAKSGNGVGYALSALGTLIAHTICCPFSILTGTHFLSPFEQEFEDDEDDLNLTLSARLEDVQDPLSLRYTSTAKRDVVLNIETNLWTAIPKYREELYLRLVSVLHGISYTLSSPAFVASEILIFASLWVGIFTKAMMCIPVGVRNLTDGIFGSSEPALERNPVRLSQLRQKHDAAYQAKKEAQKAEMPSEEIDNASPRAQYV